MKVVTEVVVAVEVIGEVVEEEDPTRNLTLLRKPSLLWVNLPPSDDFLFGNQLGEIAKYLKDSSQVDK